MTSDQANTIQRVVLDIAQRVQPELEAVMPSQALVRDLGFQSMDIAELIAVLEIEFGKDPFAELVSIRDLHTVGDLYRAYELVLA